MHAHTLQVHTTASTHLHSYVTLTASLIPLPPSVSGVFPFPPLLPSAVSAPPPFSSHPPPSSASQQPTFLCSQAQMSSFPTGPQRWEAVEQVAAPLSPPPPPQNWAQQIQQRANTRGATDDWKDEAHVLTYVRMQYMCILTCMYVCGMHETCTYVRLYVCVYVRRYKWTYVQIRICTYTHTVYAYIHVYIHTYIYVRMYLPIIVRSVRSMHWNSCKPRANMGRNMLGPYWHMCRSSETHTHTYTQAYTHKYNIKVTSISS